MKTYTIIFMAIFTVFSCSRAKEESQLQKTNIEFGKTSTSNAQSIVYQQNTHKKQTHEVNGTLQPSHITNSNSKKRYNESALLQQNDTFEFLKSPTSLMNYIFTSAKSGDFSKFHYMCDPYGDNDGDTKAICSMQMLSQEEKEAFITDLGNAKIIGEPVIVADKAEVEFTFGPTANKRETMHLIKRNGLWYLDSF